MALGIPLKVGTTASSPANSLSITTVYPGMERQGTTTFSSTGPLTRAVSPHAANRTLVPGTHASRPLVRRVSTSTAFLSLDHRRAEYANQAVRLQDRYEP